MHRLAGFFVAFTILFGSIHSPALAQDKSLTVFAAASMKNALDDVDAAYTAKTGVKISASPFVLEISGARENAVSVAILPSE